MAEPVFLPKLSSLPLESVLQQLSFVEGGVNNALDKIWVKDIVFDKNSSGDKGVYQARSTFH